MASETALERVKSGGRKTASGQHRSAVTRASQNQHRTSLLRRKQRTRQTAVLSTRRQLAVLATQDGRVAQQMRRTHPSRPLVAQRRSSAMPIAQNTSKLPSIWRLLPDIGKTRCSVQLLRAIRVSLVEAMRPDLHRAVAPARGKPERFAHQAPCDYLVCSAQRFLRASTFQLCPFKPVMS